MERAAGCWQAICIPFGEITKFIFFMSWTSPGKELGGLQTLVMLGQLPPLQQDRKKMYFSPCPGVGSWGLGVQSGKWEGWKRVGRVGKEPYRCQPWGLASPLLLHVPELRAPCCPHCSPHLPRRSSSKWILVAAILHYFWWWSQRGWGPGFPLLHLCHRWCLPDLAVCLFRESSQGQACAAESSWVAAEQLHISVVCFVRSTCIYSFPPLRVGWKMSFSWWFGMVSRISFAS